MSPTALIDRMKTVCAGEGIEAEDGALELIARLSQGSFRDALNMLEFCSGESKNITAEGAGSLLGTSSVQTLSALAAAIADGNVEAALNTVNEIYLSSRDITVFWREFISFLRDALVCAVTRGQKSADPETLAAAGKFAPARLVETIEIFTFAEADMTKTPSSAKLYAELALIKATAPSVRSDDAAVSERLSAVESALKRLSSGGVNQIYVGEPERKGEIKEEKPNNAAPEKPAAKSAEIRPAQKKFSSFRKWMDVLRRVSQIDSATSAGLYGAKVLESDDGKVYIFFEKQFSADVINNSPYSKKNIASAIFDITGRNIMTDDIIINVEKNAEEIIHEPIDDVIAKIKEYEGEQQ